MPVSPTKVALKYRLKRLAMEVSNDSRHLYVIGPFHLKEVFEDSEWPDLASKIWNPPGTPTDPDQDDDKIISMMNRIIRRHWGGVFETDGDGTWDVVMPDAISEAGQIIPGEPDGGTVKQAKEFKVDIGTLVLYGKYKNKKGRIKGFTKDPKGNPIVIVEPIPKGRKQDKELQLFRIWGMPKDQQEQAKEQMKEEP